MGAVMHAVKVHGYPSTSVREITSLAGVSNSTFYGQFGSLDDCFLSAFDSIVAGEVEQIRSSFLAESGYKRQLRSAFETYLDIAVDQPDRTRFVVLESLRLGAVGLASQQRVSEIYEGLVSRASVDSDGQQAISELAIRAIVGGIRSLLQRRVRSGEVKELRQHIDVLLAWGFSYRMSANLDALDLAQRQPRLPPIGQPAADEVWDERPDSIRDRTRLTQRERMVRGAAMVVAENGYGKLSIPAITGAAGVSNQTFYEHFSSAQEAFLEAIDVIGLHAATRVGTAAELADGWVERLLSGLARLLIFLATNPLTARLPFIEAPAAGSEGLDRVGMLVDGMVALFDLKNIPAEVGHPLADVVIEAIAGGIYAVIQREIAGGRTEALPDLLPEIAFIALAPFVGT